MIASSKLNSSVPASPRMFKAVLAGSIGNALEWFDYGLYGYFASIISSQFFSSQDPVTALMLAFIVFGVGFVMRPVGGLIFGHYADRVGRRNVLTWTVMLMGVSTFIVGILPTYAQVGVLAPILLAVCRLLQGISTGGEWGSCMSFLAEYATPYNRGFIVSWSQFSIAVGLLLGSGSGAILSSLLSPEDMNAWGWRLPFLSGILIAAYGLYIRRKIDETPVFKGCEDAQALVQTPLKTVFKHYKRETILSFGIVIGWTISYWIIMAYMPTYISKVLKFPLSVGLSFNTFLIIIFMIAIPFTGMLADKVGRKPVMMGAALGLIVLGYPVFYLLSTTESSVMFLAGLVVLAVLEAMICGGATVYMTEIFPTNIRCSAIAVGYNIAVACFGGTAPFVSTWLISVTGSNLAPTYYLIAGAMVTLLVLVLLAEETHNKELA
ncbi:MFS transporter [Sporomusa termitida]|uniref:Putative proline/betaine transporter n=1 Tax=Sporomusa termitida TaxID=2377 RepID=A0A517DWJ6_9FIRM|nr:MFS transporter [Sporomusa termitida]QDR81722.1 Proline/betaine transporter [Sporomusa termitida]